MDVVLMKNVIPAGRLAVICFLLSALIFMASLFSGKTLGFSRELWYLTYWGPALYFCLFAFVLRYLYKGFKYQVSIRAAFLGAVFATGAYLTSLEGGLIVLGMYMMVLSFFHFSEFMSVALTNPKTLTIDSFILNHSVQYAVAAIVSWIEFGIEYYFFPEMKTVYWLSAIGVLMCIAGEGFRKAAMFTAKTNFNHTVQYVKQPDHRLVTHGVYRFCRHPSYVGWFYWSIGTQITLLNPICIILYTGLSWVFFKERIYAEELTLLTFFGRSYMDYQRRVGTGLPFIRGYRLDEDDELMMRHIEKTSYKLRKKGYNYEVRSLCEIRSPWATFLRPVRSVPEFPHSSTNCLSNPNGMLQDPEPIRDKEPGNLSSNLDGVGVSPIRSMLQYVLTSNKVLNRILKRF